jgi:two-component system, NarL family, nitrate/nitrite response regulator NarL
MTLRVLVVSDVRVVQQGLCSILAQQHGVDVVNTVDMLHAKDQSVRLRPDVVLFDAARQDCLDLLKELVAAAPDSRVVAFGVREKADEILVLAAAGTAGYVSDSADSGDVVRVLEGVMCDELACSPRAAASLYRRVAMLSPHGSETTDVGDLCETCPVPLSRRELEIAHLIDRGLTNKVIGRQLGIEAATVKNHIHNICEKLNVHRRGEAIARIRALLPARSPLPEPWTATEPTVRTTSLPANPAESPANARTSPADPRPQGAKILR